MIHFSQYTTQCVVDEDISNTDIPVYPPQQVGKYLQRRLQPIQSIGNNNLT